MSDLDVTVVLGPGLRADSDLLRETVAAQWASLGVTGGFVVAEDVTALRRALAEAAGPQAADAQAAGPQAADAQAADAQAAGSRAAGAVVAVPGADPDARRLMTEPEEYQARTVWYDLTRTGPVTVAEGAAHQYGRGVWGLCWAVRHAVYRLRWPARRIHYGEHPDQWGELRLPSDADALANADPGVPGPPVAVLVHGGFWRSLWAADLMDALAIDLAERGFAAWNLEYRRPDRHGWGATTADLAAGLAALARLPVPVDLSRVAVLGHSAGGQLALQTAADTGSPAAPAADASDVERIVRVAVAVSLAGVVDLAEAERRWLGNGAVETALGGTPASVPERYAAADPLARLPLRVPQLLVQGRQDDLDLIDLNRRYAAAARAAGDEVTHLEQPGDHFSVIDPRAPIWHATAAALAARLGPG